MPPQVIRLPDGQTFTVSPVFAGLGFKSHELNTHPNAFPIGWTVVLRTEEGDDDHHHEEQQRSYKDADDEDRPRPRRHIHSFREPTLENDTLFISSIANPSSSEFKPAASPTRQIAMMLWITLYWYFHQTPPNLALTTEASKNTPDDGKPKGSWKINIRKDGVLRGRNLIPKLERMGLIASADPAVGISVDDSGGAWSNMFVSRSMFWQIPSRLFLFTLASNRALSSSFPGSPATSRPNSPVRGGSSRPGSPHLLSVPPVEADLPGGPMPTTLAVAPGFPVTPYYSTSHLPTYFPPPPMQFVMTNGVRHPLRPKPPRMGELLYTRFVPSVGQYLSFRVASSSPKPVPYLGPIGPDAPENAHLGTLSDTSLLQMWLSVPRVKKFWGDYTPTFLKDGLCSKHSFPVIGMWDGVPFGYFEIYWVKEDILGRHLGQEAGYWDRGVHVLVGEEWARGRVPIWLTALAHWTFGMDFRTMNLCLEPRVDNKRFLERLDATGFTKVKQVSFPHKQSWLVKLQREQWEGPVL